MTSHRRLPAYPIPIPEDWSEVQEGVLDVRMEGIERLHRPPLRQMDGCQEMGDNVLSYENTEPRGDRQVWTPAVLEVLRRAAGYLRTLPQIRHDLKTSGFRLTGDRTTDFAKIRGSCDGLKRRGRILHVTWMGAPGYTFKKEERT
jgi:hypothetical protein